MRSLGLAYTRQKLHLDFTSLKHTCPKGVYVAPLPDEPLTWAGVLFVRKGPYANAVLRFRIDFPDLYPDHTPTVTILSDVFHPLVTPLTTYSYSSRDTSAEGASAADRDRLPPGGLSLRHGFPEWYGSSSATLTSRGGAEDGDAQQRDKKGLRLDTDLGHGGARQPPLALETLQYLRIIFSIEAVLDSVPLEAAANTGAWHAWRTYRAKIIGVKERVATGETTGASSTARLERSVSPPQQPGGARRPGEWNWQGVWEDRVRKSVQASISEHTLFGGDGADAICFAKMDVEAVAEIMPKMGGE